MTGINQSIKVTLRNPLDHTDQIGYTIQVFENSLAQDWYRALREIIYNGNLLEKNFCFLGFPDTARNLNYLCQELNLAIGTVNAFFDDYKIKETYTPETLRTGLDPNQDLMNHLHNHFEILQGTVENLSDYYRRADYETKYAIRQLNLICHELESLMLSLRKKVTTPDWVRSSQITTFINCRRYELTEEHRQLFNQNGYDRRFGHVYMHWTQIGKTLFEVFRDEGAPELTDTVCEAINSLKYYSGEFDVEWATSIYYNDQDKFPWHIEEQDRFRDWLLGNKLDPLDPKLSLGHLPIGEIDLKASFGTTNQDEIWDILSKHLDIYSIEVEGVKNTFDYCWTDSNYKQMQINMMRPGYDHSSRG